ncbi:MAG: exostosin family protein [Henriciella sp.]|nr:exostosin family protein [Henriciella sp.]MBO6693954.1 exostosin family protein [Henriciella sp.]
MNKLVAKPDEPKNRKKQLLAESGIGIHAYNNYWQKPAATEEAAFRAISKSESNHGFDYLAFAWATLIDGVANRTRSAREILSALGNTKRDLTREPKKRCTVAQHIRADEFIEIFATMGVTDLFWSHATTSVTEMNGIRVHPFPLFPAQAPDFVGSSAPEKRYLANFVGAYNPKIYLSNVRKVIFEDARTEPDLRIVKRGQWHFDRAVYHEQVQGRTPSHAELSKEDTEKQEYLQAIRSSWFTLCPTGSGPNSIRLFECLALGSIPIILTKDLRLPGDQSLWQRAAIIEEDSEQGYRQALDCAKQITVDDRIAMLKAGKDLYSVVGPAGYKNIIVEQMSLYER